MKFRHISDQLLTTSVSNPRLPGLGGQAVRERDDLNAINIEKQTDGLWERKSMSKKGIRN